MVKVLLIYEDYSEMSTTISDLKKVGFDVVGISQEKSMFDKFLEFNPEVVVAYGRNIRVSSLSVGRKLRDYVKYTGKVVLIFPQGHRPNPEEILQMRLDAIVEAPVDPQRLIQVLSRLSGEDTDSKVDKFNKAHYKHEKEELITVSGSGVIEDRNPNRDSARLIDLDRRKRYEEFLKNEQLPNPVDSSSHQREEVRTEQAKLKKGWDFDGLEDIDELKREFAKALFKKDE